MKKDKLIISALIMIALISLNYHIWINKIKALIEKSRIWQTFTNLLVSKSSVAFDSSDYMIVEENASASRSTVSIKEFTSQQVKEFKADDLMYSMLNKNYERITQRIKTVNNAIRTSAKQYISSNEFVSSTRKMIQMLAVAISFISRKLLSKFTSSEEDWKSHLLWIKSNNELHIEKIYVCR
jgi:hypothetical protein